MKNKLARLMLTIAAACTVVNPAAAGEKKGAFSLSPYLGGYTFDGVQHMDTAPVFGLRLGYDVTKNWEVEAVGDYLAAESPHRKHSANALGYRLDVLYNFLADGPLVPYLAAGGGGTTIGHGSSFNNSQGNLLGYTGGRNTAAVADAGGGLKYYVTDSVALRGDARQLFVFGQKTIYNWEYTVGLTFLCGRKSAPAPAVAAAPAPVPPPPAAPTSSLSATPGSVTKGQQAKLSWTSQNTTNCDIQPGIGTVEPQGSMTVTPDADTSYALSCSGPGGTTKSAASISVASPAPRAVSPAPTSTLAVTPRSIKKGESATLNWTSKNATNCEIQPGIGAVQPQGSMTINPADDTSYTLTCTGEGGSTTSAGAVQVASPPPPAAPKQEKLSIALKVEFDTGKADIKKKFHSEIGRVAEFLKEYPEVKGVIEGHTDNVGGNEYNMKLSERRAASVRNYLVEKFGIAPERLSSKGYGLTKPVSDNKTNEGRQKNRRIEATFDTVVITK